MDTLIEWGAPLDYVDEWGATLLHLAAASIHPRSSDIIKVQVPLPWAAASLASIAVNPQKLVNASWIAGSGISGDENEHGYFALDVNAPDLRGCTPLHYAAGCGDERVVAYVLSQGADPSAEDVEGKGALQWVHLLLLFSPGGMTGHTPMYYAESTGGEKCIKLIDQFVEFQKLNSLSKESSLLRAAGGGDSLELVPKDWDREFDPVSGYYFYIHKRTVSAHACGCRCL